MMAHLSTPPSNPRRGARVLRSMQIIEEEKQTEKLLSIWKISLPTKGFFSVRRGENLLVIRKLAREIVTHSSFNFFARVRVAANQFFNPSALISYRSRNNRFNRAHTWRRYNSATMKSNSTQGFALLGNIIQLAPRRRFASIRLCRAHLIGERLPTAHN